MGDREELTFDGTVVVVTGGGRGIGRGYVEDLARRGARVVVNNPTPGPGIEAVEAIRAAGGTAVVDHSDVADPAGAEALVATALDAFGRLDVLVNNAGVNARGPFPRVTFEELERVWRVHLGGTFNTCQAAWPHLVRQGGGRIVNTTSGAGIYGLALCSAYAAAKGAVNALTLTLALEGERVGIAVNAISPAALTSMTRFAVTDPTSTAQWEALSVDLVTPVLAWLAHPSCTRTGEIYEAFGGRVAQVLVGETLGIQDPALSTASIVAGLDAVHDRSRVAYPAHARDIGAAVDAAGGARRAPDAGE